MGMDTPRTKADTKSHAIFMPFGKIAFPLLASCQALTKNYHKQLKTTIILNYQGTLPQ